MADVQRFPVAPSWRLTLNDLGISAENVLRRANLPADLFGRERSSLTPEQYFALWQAAEEESGNPQLALHFGSQMRVEGFDPPVFAALCSPDLNVALQRIARYKRLCMPMELTVDIEAQSTRLGFEWLHTQATPPASLGALELIFFTQLARIATRHHVRPIALAVPELPGALDAYEAYFGAPLMRGDMAVTFSGEDAARPFLTADEKMWEFFEPELQRRLAELDASASTADRSWAESTPHIDINTTGRTNASLRDVFISCLH